MTGKMAYKIPCCLQIVAHAKKKPAKKNRKAYFL